MKSKVILLMLISIVSMYVYCFMQGIPVEIHQKAPFQKYWIWLDDKASDEKKLFKSERLVLRVTVDEHYKEALIFWAMKAKTLSGNTHEGFNVLYKDQGLCKKVVHIDNIGRIISETSFYKNKYGMCAEEGKVKNY